MIEILRALRLGVVNIFGIAVPGFLLVFLAGIGLLMPAMLIATDVFGGSEFTMESLPHGFILLSILVIVISYVFGYILRLSSPDILDKVSADKVLRGLEQSEPEEVKDWPYQGKKQEKFPYFHMKEYLHARDLNHLADLVTWGRSAVKSQGQQRAVGRTKRSKTAVNQMKIDISLDCQELSATVESNEAHIRLLSGTWLAICANRIPVLIGICLSLVAMIVARVAPLRYFLNIPVWFLNPNDSANYLLILVIELFILSSMNWAKNRIESLFHYRRVSELVFIIMAAHKARSRCSDAGPQGSSPPPNS